MQQTQQTDPYIQAILNGDSDKLRELYRKAFPMIKQYILKNSGTEEDAKDNYMDSLMVLFEKAAQPGFQLKAQLSTFLFSISKFLWLNQLRKKHRNEVTIPEDDTLISDLDINVNIELMERQKLFDKHFVRLGNDCQRILLYYFAEKSMREIADLEQLSSEVTARKRKSRCQKQLIDFIQQDSVYQELHKHS
ncbi:MAG: sigma-70 family RNA polymerase sigma factor [Saprospiraceae bacterium]